MGISEAQSGTRLVGAYKYDDRSTALTVIRRCIIKLGTTGAISGFDIDTSHFSGNEAPEVSVEALYSPSDEPRVDDAKVSFNLSND